MKNMACFSIAALALLLTSTSAWAQDTTERVAEVPQTQAAPPAKQPGIKTFFKDLYGDVKHLPSKGNAITAGIGGGLALAAHPWDDDVNRRLVGNTSAERFFKPGQVLGQFPTLITAAGTVYAVGRIGDQPKTAHVGMDLIQSLIVSEGIVQTLKFVTRRERPDHSGHNSFPSGHAADTFAFATALERHLQWRAVIPVYAFAGYVAVSRLPANRHWLSDTVFGATVGIISGRTVTRHGRDFPVVVSPMPGGGVYVGYTRTR